MADSIYLNPTGLVYGAIAREAIAAGKAGRLAGDEIAFSAVQLLQGKPGAVVRELRGYEEISSSVDQTLNDGLKLLELERTQLARSEHNGSLLMGVVNVTPDSFSDGGDFLNAQIAIDHGKSLVAAGADILDIGGESTRPGAEPVSSEDELARVLPVIEGLVGLTQPLSIDTRKSEVMLQAANMGASIINDVAALTYDEDSIATAAHLNQPVILMHAQGDPRTMQDNPVYEDVVLEVYDWLFERLDKALDSGIDRRNLLIDPGIGFGKNLDHNLELLAHLSFFHGLGVPIVLGASRKRFIGALSDAQEAKDRMPGSISAALQGASHGVQVIRVHDVAETRQALSVSQAILAT